MAQWIIDYQARLKRRHNQRGSMETMRSAVFNYIGSDYNRLRRHSECGELSPEQFENQNLA
ncbi:hypothetical protein NM75_08600 [Dickeya fangzhongdai]|nr:hypothetical protein LH89_10450 [Dickeya fangzhongdai]KGT98694.1 hypothetical protein NM75_08600 [Dickeya fangzhongdai]